MKRIVLLIATVLLSGVSYAEQITCNNAIGFKNIEDFKKTGRLDNNEVRLKFIFHLSLKGEIGVFERGEGVKIVATKYGGKIVQVRGDGEWEEFWIPGSCLK